MSVLTPTERKQYRARVRAAATPAERAAIRAERAALRSERRAERREDGKAWDQVLARLIADVVDEEEAREMVRDMGEDLLPLVASGELDAAVDLVLAELEESGDALVDFAEVPTIGWLLELADGPVIRAASGALRPWVQRLILDALADERAS